MNPIRAFYLCGFVCICGAIIFLSGCASAVEAGQNTALNGTDLIAMTDDMAMKILASPAVQQAIAREKTLKVVVQPVVNQMRAEVLPKGPADAFTARLRSLLSHHAPDQFTWIMNRNAFYSLRNQQLSGVELGPSPDAINPEYALTATFTSLADENSQGRSSYYVCVYDLTNLQTRDVLWTGSYEVQKKAVKGFLD
jgi:PBP1b-binding outer membrane lipoprotein LpoB